MQHKSDMTEYKELILELYDTIYKILAYLGVKDINISPYDIDADFDNFNKGNFLYYLRLSFMAKGIII